MICPACKEELNRNSKIKLGVSERIHLISQYEEPKHPDHRPSYINAIPLIDIIRSIKGIKSHSSKIVRKAYEEIIEKFGIEYDILLELPIEQINEHDESIANVIQVMRKGEIEYTPGGGGTYGEIKFEI